ncbi:hypothetical protein ES332_D10G218100v1 [Gossypium tomentosum]|uniref:Uncharacterized protein n=1 Tax=Gossypium tomentosum TaxID=34277 RepID=A0A5D2J6U1_GOSTO|nr:hypothetical protein ES332_D10G218100v1 [Gossypium tomentosum]
MVLNIFQLIKRVRWHPLSQPCHQLAGVNKFADLVGVTLGPKGRNVVLESKYHYSKTGFSRRFFTAIAAFLCASNTFSGAYRNAANDCAANYSGASSNKRRYR